VRRRRRTLVPGNSLADLIEVVISEEEEDDDISAR
jgi:hypothetical protein